MKQAKTCTAQFAADVPQDPWSENGGNGFEHHLPHWYSQVGVGVDTIVDVHRDTVVLLVVGVGEVCRLKSAIKQSLVDRIHYCWFRRASMPIARGCVGRCCTCGGRLVSSQLLSIGSSKEGALTVGLQVYPLQGLVGEVCSKLVT